MGWENHENPILSKISSYNLHSTYTWVHRREFPVEILNFDQSAKMNLYPLFFNK